MQIKDFELYRDMLYKKSGLVITPDKTYLLDSRLTPIAKQFGHNSLDAMTMSLMGMPDPKMVDAIVEAMTTNETSFFRDQTPFKIFETYTLPKLLEKNKTSRSLKIWCAACSSGQEPYSLSMILKENADKTAGWNIEIIGTDISDGILAQAKEAVYSQFEVQRGLPVTMLMKYFKQQDEKWAVNDDVKAMVSYKNFNLLDNMQALGTFDLIFCRNVLIYFDNPLKTKVLENMDKQLAPNGFLVLGGSETVMGITDKFKPVKDQRGLYARPAEMPE